LYIPRQASITGRSSPFCPLSFHRIIPAAITDLQDSRFELMTGTVEFSGWIQTWHGFPCIAFHCIVPRGFAGCSHGFQMAGFLYFFLTSTSPSNHIPAIISPRNIQQVLRKQIQIKPGQHSLQRLYSHSRRPTRRSSQNTTCCPQLQMIEFAPIPMEDPIFPEGILPLSSHVVRNQPTLVWTRHKLNFLIHI
jgi:hypothetical protein